jgi:hypothetical protein
MLTAAIRTAEDQGDTDRIVELQKEKQELRSRRPEF